MNRNLLIRILTHEYVALALRLYIGALFIYASMYKINYPAEFAETIASYQLAPYWSVNFLAIFMPWLELVCGVLLVVGFRAKSAVTIIGGLLVVFTVAVTINLWRGSPIPCGCFTSVDDPISWRTAVRDVIWVAMTVHIFFFDKILHLENHFTSKLEKMA
ncbi:Methylamine utilisation protein MauE [Desulfonatronum thiosulfatophilum]|uniref:Methylamine utilisation protein MauE n=1 Tax=Desulfonatronum thiosulfatophilum TaxID=617002 RepID=A0A1G6ED59_9BACT|nr:MauE/DoxX family redox-associated membrane protein [Desulfonatronum thiosulfatophilum]SDB55364.1 Methylamine utilisation protein MauE [Desulfonatronum thiosulfatophilum]